MKHLLFVILGAVLGSTARFSISYLLGMKVADGNMHWITLGINVFGSFLLGFLAAYFIEHSTSKELEMFVTVGFCATFTTFSTFSLESLQLLKSGNYSAFFAYILLSVILGILAAFLGWSLIKH